jgi:hypothetical protein
MRLGLWLLMPAALLAAAAGCSRGIEVRFPNPMPMSSVDVATGERAARGVLRDMRFDIVYPPAKPGLVETEPMTGSSWFEFWREDTIGSYQTAESSLHTIRRRVTVAVTPASKGSQVSVKVEKQRMSAPDSAPQHISAAFNIYRPGDTDLLRQDEMAPHTYRWIEIGRDDALEQRILEHIQLRSAPGARLPR